jgi:hypothetical protein
MGDLLTRKQRRLLRPRGVLAVVAILVGLSICAKLLVSSNIVHQDLPQWLLKNGSPLIKEKHPSPATKQNA